MKIEVLGTGCPKCMQLLSNVQAAVAETGVEAEISKVEDITEIVAYGVMLTPALVIDGEIKTVGKVPAAEEIKALLV